MPPRFGTGTISFGMRTWPASGSAYSRAAENVTWCNTAQAAARGASISDQVAYSLASRHRAITIIAATKNGDDPAAKRDAERQAITVTELAQRFEKEHIDIRLKPSTAKGYRRMLERFVLPTLGHYRVNQVTRPDIAKFHHDLRHTPYDANRCLEMVSKMFNLAEMWGLRPDEAHQ